MRAALFPAALLIAGAIQACASASGLSADRAAIEAAGVELPRRVGEYEVTLVSYGGDPAQGAFVRYEHDDSVAPLPRIDVVVYPADLPLSAEIQASHADQLAADDASRHVDDTTLLREQFSPRRDTYRATYYVELSDVPMRSLVWLHAIDGRWVKARATLLLVPGYDPVAAIEDAVEALFAAAEQGGRRAEGGGRRAQDERRPPSSVIVRPRSPRS